MKRRVQNFEVAKPMIQNCSVSFCTGENSANNVTSMDVNNSNNLSVTSYGGDRTRRLLGLVKQQPLVEDYSPEAEALIVKELTQLSMKERSGIEEEIHGVADDEVEETEEFLERSLKQFQLEVDGIRSNKNNIKLKAAYERALFLSPSYVNNVKFRLMFLRADRFQPLPAARRFIKFFESKLEFFGLDRLCKDITWDDLSEDDRAAVHTGSIWFSDWKDRAGRSTVWLNQKYERYSTYKNQIRNVWYQMMNLLQNDETAQRKGFVKIVYNVGWGKIPTLDPDLMFKGAPSIFEALPFRMAAMHCCYDDPLIRPAITTIQHVIGRAGRVRFRAHYGSHLECQYALVTFGIPRECIPFTDAGKLQLNQFYDHLERRKQTEYQATCVKSGDVDGGTNSISSLIHPKSNDVLLGRGRPYQEFPGNLRLAMIIDKYRERYFEAGRCDKAIISQHLVDTIKKDGRFLKKVSDGDSSSSSKKGSNTKSHEWVEVSDGVARDKVSHGFRTKTRRNTPQLTSSGSSKKASSRRNSLDGDEKLTDQPSQVIPLATKSFFGFGFDRQNHISQPSQVQDAKRLRATTTPMHF